MTSSIKEEQLAWMYKHLLELYTLGETSSVSEAEAMQIAESLAYVLRLEADEGDAAWQLASQDPRIILEAQLQELDSKVDSALETWQQVCILMPDIRNVALRDTLASIGTIKQRYDTRFAAHSVPCDIDYQLSEPVNDRQLKGVDFVQAWLDQLLKETEWIAQFTTESCIAALEDACPDYRGLHVNLYDLLRPREDRLVRTRIVS